MYLLLKLSKVNIKNHPVAKRLFQYRKILSQFDFPFESTIKPQIMLLLQENASAESADVSQQKHKTLKVLKKIGKRSVEEKKIAESETEVAEPPLKKKKKVEMQVESNESEDSGVVENEVGGDADSKIGKFLAKVVNLWIYYFNQSCQRKKDQLLINYETNCIRICLQICILRYKTFNPD